MRFYFSDAFHLSNVHNTFLNSLLKTQKPDKQTKGRNAAKNGLCIRIRPFFFLLVCPVLFILPVITFLSFACFAPRLGFVLLKVFTLVYILCVIFVIQKALLPYERTWPIMAIKEPIPFTFVFLIAGTAAWRRAAPASAHLRGGCRRCPARRGRRRRWSRTRR